MYPAPFLPPGTQVVLRVPLADAAGGTAQRGATGRVDRAACDGTYVVRLADTREVIVRRDQVSLRKAYQHDMAIGHTGRLQPDELVHDHTVYAAVVGSRAFGLAGADSDTDVRGVYVAPTEAFWSLVKPPAHVEGPGPEEFFWEVERFCELALKANPNVLEVLHFPMVRICTELGSELVDLREAFLSQLAVQTYSGYVLSQFKKIEADLRTRGEPKWKHVMHLLRLLLSVRDLVITGNLVLDAGEHREHLLAVRSGEVEWPEVERWRLQLHRDLDTALERTPLAAVPDVERVDRWLRSVRRRGVR